MIFVISVLCMAIFVYNFVAKKKVNFIELILLSLIIVALIVAIIYCSINRFNVGASSLNPLFTSYISSFYEYLGVVIVLLVSKIIVIVANKREQKMEK